MTGKFRKKAARRSTGIAAITAALVLGSGVMLMPFVWMGLTSFKTFAETLVFPIQWLPERWSLENFEWVLDSLNFDRYYVNTLCVTAIVTVVQVFFCSLAAYSFARVEFPFRNALFFLLLSVLMIPQQMTLLPNYVMLSNLGWIDTYLALTIPHFFSAYGTFFLRQFFLTLPKELEESAIIDGCSLFRVYRSILMPLCGPSVAAFSIFTVLWAWNDLMWPLIMTSTDGLRTLSVGIATLVGQYGTKNNILMAASLLATLPMIIIFIFCQKQFIRGIATTGLKV